MMTLRFAFFFIFVLNLAIVDLILSLSILLVPSSVGRSSGRLSLKLSIRELKMASGFPVGLLSMICSSGAYHDGLFVPDFLPLLDFLFDDDLYFFAV